MLPPQQDRMIAHLDNPRVHQIDAGHLAMLSAPASVAEVITREASPVELSGEVA